MIFLRSTIVCLLGLSLGIATGCSRAEDAQPPVATPAVRLSSPKASLGSPIEVTYRFQVASDAPVLDRDYRVFVHFVDNDGEMMWADDHPPAVPTTQWKAGQVVEYTRTMFVPVYPYIGDAGIQVGLYSPSDGRRLPLAGQDVGQRSYMVGALQILPQSDNVFLIYREGWHPTEVAPDNSAVEWQWTRKVATIAFKNPKRDSIFYLHADNPGSVFTEGQTVQILLNGQPVETMTIKPQQEQITRTRLSAAQLGSGDMAELRLEVDKTYVPALVPAANSRDSRELGIRVFHAFVEPR
jgi:hypothetical protein